jgi:hypothetical protein
MSFVAVKDGKQEETKKSEKDRNIEMLGNEIFGEDFKNGLSDDEEKFAEIAEIEAIDTFGEIDF